MRHINGQCPKSANCYRCEYERGRAVGRKEMRAEERADVVAYLRKKSEDDCGDGAYFDRYALAAEEIELGEHANLKLRTR